MRATRATTNHVPISKYHLRFFSKEEFKCLCRIYPIKSRHHILHKYRMLWDTWTLTIFLFLFFYFSDFILIFFFFSFLFLLDDEEAHDTTVTWHVTWCDVIGLEHGGRVWKMMLGHMKTTWWPWVGNEMDMRAGLIISSMDHVYFV